MECGIEPPHPFFYRYGFDGSGRLNTIESYNPHFRTWKEVAKFKSDLSSPACAVLNGKMYITGGKNSKNRAVATSAFYDPVLKDIIVTTDLQIPRFGHGLVELDGFIYAVGGYGDDGGRVDSVVRSHLTHNPPPHDQLRVWLHLTAGFPFLSTQI